MTAKVSAELRGLRAKAALYDELVEQLADSERELEQVRRSAARDGIDPAWREIANDLAGALRPYTLLSQRRRRECGEGPAVVRVDGVLDGSAAVSS